MKQKILLTRKIILMQFIIISIFVFDYKAISQTVEKLHYEDLVPDQISNGATISQGKKIQPTNVLQAAQLHVWIPDTSAASGSTINIPIYVDNVTGQEIYAAGIKLSFDQNILDATGATGSGTISSDWGAPTVKDSPGEITLGMAGSSALSGRGKLVYISFEIVGSGSTIIHFEEMTFNEGIPSVTTDDGLFRSGGSTEGINVSIPDTSAAAGTSIKIPVYIDDVSGQDIFSAGITITFNQSILDATGAAVTGTIASIWGAPTVSDSPGKIKIGMAGSNPLSGKGKLLYINFDVIGQGSTTVHFDEMIFNEGEPSAITDDGLFSSTGGNVPNIVVEPDTLRFRVGENNNVKTNGYSLKIEQNDQFKPVKNLSEFIPWQNMQSLNSSSGFASDPDTLSNTFDPPFFYINPEYQTMYEATRLLPKQNCTVKRLFYAFTNYESLTVSKECEFFVLRDKGGQPDEELWSDIYIIELQGNKASWFYVDVDDANLEFDESFWIGHRELTQGSPSSLLDTLETPGANAYSENGNEWFASPFDYLQMAVVEYDNGGSANSDTQILTIRNTGSAMLSVDNISATAPWVTSISPYSLTISPGGSQTVSVEVSDENLSPGLYKGVIKIDSNDPDTPHYQEPMIFRVNLEDEKFPHILVEPDTLKFIIDQQTNTVINNCSLLMEHNNDFELNRCFNRLSHLKNENRLNSTDAFASDLDTLSHTFDPPLFYLNPEYQTMYEATRLLPEQKCTLKKLLFAFTNYEFSTKSKECEFYILDDNNGQPNDMLWSESFLIELGGDEAGWFYVDVDDANLEFDTSFWIGHRELTQGSPSSLIDTLETPGANAFSENGNEWYASPFDYLQMAVVEYENGGSNGNDTQLMIIRNNGDALLNVHDVSTTVPWVISIEPIWLEISPGGSQTVSIKVAGDDLMPGKHEGVLEISSNDPNTPLFLEPILLEIRGGTQEPDIAVTPDTLRFFAGTSGLLLSSEKSLLDGGMARDYIDATKKINDASQKVSCANGRSSRQNGDLDTLSFEYSETLAVLQDQYQVYYEATRFNPKKPCTLEDILFAFWNYETSSKSKECEFFIWNDNNGSPGTKILTTSGDISLDSDQASWIRWDVSAAQLVFDRPFWVGHREAASGAPSSLVDTLGTPGANVYSEDGEQWYTSPFDYLHMVVVNYDGDPEEKEFDILTVNNLGDAPLEVADIYSDQSWVTSVSETSFILSPGESKNVTVGVNKYGLETRTYLGTLQILSNDPDSKKTKVYLKFIVKTGIADVDVSLPIAFNLYQNKPNPFNPVTRIVFSVPRQQHVGIRIFNMIGQEIRLLTDQIYQAGNYDLLWDGKDNAGIDVASGIYIYYLQSTNYTDSKKMTLLR